MYGEEVAILAGDALLSLSFEYIARETRGVAAERVLQVVVEVGKAVGSEGLVAGQVVDIKSEGAGADVGIETLQYIHEHKTAALLEAAVVSGAILGGAGEVDVDRLRKYSRSIGLAFQVRQGCGGVGGCRGRELRGPLWPHVPGASCSLRGGPSALRQQPAAARGGLQGCACTAVDARPGRAPRCCTVLPSSPLQAVDDILDITPTPAALSAELTLVAPTFLPVFLSSPLQVVDDILDITATTEELGKTAGKDLASAKTTYPSLVGLERSREVRAACGGLQAAAAGGWLLLLGAGGGVEGLGCHCYYSGAVAVLLPHLPALPALPSPALPCLQIADELIEEAKSMLTTYDPVKAAPLYALAEYIRSRKN